MREFILASKSPRRIEILGRYNLEIKTIESGIIEDQTYYKNPEQLAMAMAFEKAMNIAKDYPSSIVLAADTIVALGNKALGKPKDLNEAEKMLKDLSGKEHRVITAYSIICLEEKIKIVEYKKTKVWFKTLGDETINKYLRTNEYIDKAGAYAIQGFGTVLIEKIEGDYENVVGLPISSISDLLKDVFNIELL